MTCWNSSFESRRDVSMPDLTERQHQVLAFIGGRIRKDGFAPSLRELCSHFGFSSTNSAWLHIHALTRKGMLLQTPVKVRGEVIPVEKCAECDVSVVRDLGRCACVPAMEGESSDSAVRELVSVPRDAARRLFGSHLPLGSACWVHRKVLEKRAPEFLTRRGDG